MFRKNRNKPVNLDCYFGHNSSEVSEDECVGAIGNESATELGLNFEEEEEIPENEEHSDLQANQSGLSIPKFSLDMPKSWLLKVEVIFRHAKMTQKDKFGHIVNALPLEMILPLEPNIKFRPCASSYNDLRVAVFKQAKLLNKKRLQNFMSKQGLDEYKPTGYLDFLKNKFGSGFFAEILSYDFDFVKELFIKQLPGNVRNTLAGVPLTTLDAVAKMADSLMGKEGLVFSDDENETSSSQIEQLRASCDTMQKECSSLSDKVGELSYMVEKLTMDFRKLGTATSEKSRSHEPSSPENRSAERSRSRSGSRNESDASPCYYHCKFGSGAYKCIRPCSFRPTN